MLRAGRRDVVELQQHSIRAVAARRLSESQDVFTVLLMSYEYSGRDVGDVVCTLQRGEGQVVHVWASERLPEFLIGPWLGCPSDAECV